MNARILVGTLCTAAVAIGLGQWSASITDQQSAYAGPSAARPAPFQANRTVSPITAQRSDARPIEPETLEGSGTNSGADIHYTSIYQIIQFSLDSDHPDYDADDPIYAYSLGSRTCNVGDASLPWVNNGTPGFASNAYRLHDGRLMQIGTGWVKHACCVANVDNPGICGMTCSQTGGGSTLNPGCLDTYSATWNSFQSKLGPRVFINPQTGTFASLTSDTFNAIDRRLQVRQSDLSAQNYPDALYFVEGVYVCTATAEAGNSNSNATYRRVTANQSTFALSLAPEEAPTVPAIFAWHDHGGGVNTVDPDVEIVTLDLPNEGRFFAGSKVSDNGDGTWRYEYAVYNLNSHQSAGAFSVEIGNGVTITNVGFHAPTYHSGEMQSNTPWQHDITENSVTWSTAQTYQQNPFGNAIRWGSMYNFWFDADQPPMQREGAIDVFIPGKDSRIIFDTTGPEDAIDPCPADLNDDQVVNVLDLLMLLENWGPCDPGDACPGDLNQSGEVGILDVLILLEAWGPCPS